MKSTSFFRIGAALLALLCARTSFAQEIARVDTLPVIVITAKSLVSKKVTEAFKSDFKDATNAKWFRINKNYLIKFLTKDQNNHALYHKNGSLYYHIAYGNGSNLPDDVRNKIKKQYSNGKIITAIQVNQDNRHVWLINMEVGKLYILVREEDGELLEVERIKNATA
ncbi:hypothetical protein BH09BAC6_BH09BAC6_30390 [soil metagenome]|jgi:6-phosphogluconolactonase (cycloisomerase 2 family)